MTDRPRVLRASTGLVWLVGVAAVALFLLGDVVVRGSWAQALLVAPWMLIPVWFVYVFLYAPHLAVDEDRVRVHNPLRTIDLPWSTVDDVVMRWQLEFHLTADAAATGVGGRKGIVESWAVTHRRRRARLDRRAMQAERTGMSSDATLEVIRGLHASVGRQPGARASASWDIPPLVAAAAIAAWCVAAVLLAG
ncbi:hypothetical protein [Microbacterium rhizophilus]|uniref:hypothetical protein n=1 Tax=Microbacterium rhizophilus TaxID=3138934 RepID=UPI0031E5E92E